MKRIYFLFIYIFLLARSIIPSLTLTCNIQARLCKNTTIWISKVYPYKCYLGLIFILSWIFKRKILTVHRYRFKHAMNDVNLCNEKYNDALIHETYVKVRQSIEAHKRAVELVLFHIAQWATKISCNQLPNVCVYLFQIRYVEKVDACHIYYFLITLGFIVVAFTTTFVRVGLNSLFRNLIASLQLKNYTI